MKDRWMLALDIGASSGRGIAGVLSPDGTLLRMEEIHRFENGFVRVGGSVVWDYLRIYRGILDCLRACKQRGLVLDAIGIDGWAQDYAYIGQGGDVLGIPRCYRDPVNIEHAPDFERDRGVDEAAHANVCGGTRIDIGTMRQLWYDRKHRPALLEAAKYYLYMPYLMIYLLTGVPGYDVSLPGIGELLDGRTMEYAEETARLLGVLDKTPPRFRRGEIIGRTDRSVFEETGYDAIPVICTEAHDTTSAVSAIPDTGDYLWISSGSYNMFGTVVSRPVLDPDLYRAGYTNTPLADGRVCLMGGGAGMYFIQRCMARWRDQGVAVTYDDLTAYAVKRRSERCFRFADVPDAAVDMPAALNAALVKAGFEATDSPYALYEAFCNSLARLTADSLLALEKQLGRTLRNVYVISGGSRADGVTQRLARALDRPVCAGLPEAAAVGNLLSQAIALCAPDTPKTDPNYFEMRRFQP